MRQTIISSAIAAAIAGVIYMIIYYFTQHAIVSGIGGTLTCIASTFVISFAINSLITRVRTR